MPLDVLRIEQNMTCETVPDLLLQGKQMIKEQASVTVDLSQLKKFDSSALALFLEWHHASQVAYHSLAFKNVPVQLVKMAELYGVNHILFSLP